MRKRLITVIAIIALGFIIIYAVPTIMQLFFIEDTTKTLLQMRMVTIWSMIVAVIIILFGVGVFKKVCHCTFW